MRTMVPSMVTPMANFFQLRSAFLVQEVGAWRVEFIEDSVSAVWNAGQRGAGPRYACKSGRSRDTEHSGQK